MTRSVLDSNAGCRCRVLKSILENFRPLRVEGRIIFITESAMRFHEKNIIRNRRYWRVLLLLSTSVYSFQSVWCPQTEKGPVNSRKR